MTPYPHSNGRSGDNESRSVYGTTLPTADVLIIGNGVIGLSIAHELASVGLECRLAGATQQGSASGAAAGLLAPALSRLPPNVRPFFADSLARYPGFLEPLRVFDHSLRMLTGLIEFLDDGDEGRVPEPGEVPLSPADLARLEPILAGQGGAAGEAVLHPHAAAIDNVRLMAALRRAVIGSEPADSPVGPAVLVDHDDPVVRVNPEGGLATLRSGVTVSAGMIVLAAGAWSNGIAGLPRTLPIEPLKGQMLALAPVPLEHPVMGGHVYLVPRQDEIAVGATVERAGFDLSTSPAALEQVRQAAVKLCPALATSPVVRTWAGLRPGTPDLLPIIGPEPTAPRLIYACGHSRNGILLAPATAAAVTALINATPVPWDLSPFSVSRFDSGLVAPERY